MDPTLNSSSCAFGCGAGVGAVSLFSLCTLKILFICVVGVVAVSFAQKQCVKRPYFEVGGGGGGASASAAATTATGSRGHGVSDSV